MSSPASKDVTPNATTTARPDAGTARQELTCPSRSLIGPKSTLSTGSRKSDDAPAISGMPENRFVVEDLESRRPRTSHSAEKWTFDRSPESRPGRRYLRWTPASVFDERPRRRLKLTRDQRSMTAPGISTAVKPASLTSAKATGSSGAVPSTRCRRRSSAGVKGCTSDTHRSQPGNNVRGSRRPQGCSGPRSPRGTHRGLEGEQAGDEHQSDAGEGQGG